MFSFNTIRSLSLSNKKRFPCKNSIGEISRNAAENIFPKIAAAKNPQSTHEIIQTGYKIIGKISQFDIKRRAKQMILSHAIIFNKVTSINVIFLKVSNNMTILNKRRQNCRRLYCCFNMTSRHALPIKFVCEFDRDANLCKYSTSTNDYPRVRKMPQKEEFPLLCRHPTQRSRSTCRKFDGICY